MPLTAFDRLLADVRACRVCAVHLPHGPRPIVQAAPSARLLIIGQAPGARVHETGVPWDDRSGTRLRDWLGLAPEVFYDASRVALVPMGLCFPGRGANGDLPPRRECAPLWLDRLLAGLPNVELTLLVGQYAQVHFLRDPPHRSVTETMRGWRAHAPRTFVLPHPSPRNIAWFKANTWFDAELLPALRAAVVACFSSPKAPHAASEATAA